MRHFIISPADDRDPAFIVAETVDRDWANDQTKLAAVMVVLSETELRLDPDLAPLLDAWNAKDDSAVEAYLAAEDAVLEAEDAIEQAALDHREELSPYARAAKAAYLAGLQERHRDMSAIALDDLDDFEERAPIVSETARRYYWVWRGLSQCLAAIRERHGVEAEAALARITGRELLSISRELTGRRPL